MWGLFAHFLGDVFTSILVLCTGLVYWFEGESAFAPYADPVCSLLSAAIIFTTGWGVTKAAGWILLQAAPSGINTTEVSTAILDIDDVVDVHEMHVWQLVDNLSLATCHIVIREGCSVKRINSVIDDVRSVFHKFKIHVSTIQQEVDSSQRRTALGECIVSKSGCVADCDAESCCPDEVSQAKAEAIALRRRRLTAAETAAAPEVR